MSKNMGLWGKTTRSCGVLQGADGNMPHSNPKLIMDTMHGFHHIVKIGQWLTSATPKVHHATNQSKCWIILDL